MPRSLCLSGVRRLVAELVIGDPGDEPVGDEEGGGAPEPRPEPERVPDGSTVDGDGTVAVSLALATPASSAAEVLILFPTTEKQRRGGGIAYTPASYRLYPPAPLDFSLEIRSLR